MNLPDARLLHNEYLMNQPFPHMVFHDEFFEFPPIYFMETEFITWLQKLTGYRNLSDAPGKGRKKKITISICAEEGDLELSHLRKAGTSKKIPGQIGTLLIFTASLPHNLECVSELYIKYYYQKLKPSLLYGMMKNETIR